MKMDFKKCGMSFLMCCFSIAANAWWEAGHMTVANIAYAHLSPSAKEKIDKLLPLMAAENTVKYKYDFNPAHPNYTFMALSKWADDLKAYPNYLSTMTTWHYIESPYVIDDTKVPELIPRDNVVTALDQLKRSLNSEKANDYVKVRNLSLIIHFVGDIHQPLHTIELYSVDFPKSDRGGNLYDVKYTEANGYEIRNLHKLWDSGINLFPSYGYSYNVSDKASIDKISQKVMEAVPLSEVAKEAYDLDVTHWKTESYQLGVQAHEVPLGSVPSANYIEKNTDAVERQLALAGYRLANLLNKIFK